MSFQDRANHYVAQLDKELAKYPLLVNLEKQTGAPKAYVVGGLAYVFPIKTNLFFFFPEGIGKLTNFLQIVAFTSFLWSSTLAVRP